MRTYKVRNAGPVVRARDVIKANKRQFVTLCALVAAAVLVIFAVAGVADRSEYGSSFLVTGDTVKIGIRTDVNAFGHYDESGDIVGFDRDVIDEIMSRMMAGQDKLYEYVSITSQDAGASIKYGETNVNLGLLVGGTERTEGFRVTAPYYKDNIVAVVHSSSVLDKLINLDGGKVGALNKALNEDELRAYLSDNEIIEETDLLRYSDYESAMTDIEHGRVDAVVMPYALARQFEERGYRVLAEPLYEIGYSVMLPTGQAAFAREMSKVIAGLEEDGTLAALREKWGL
ncbi:MAG TPA: hypothetical protein DEB31_06695 [Clostridiales bacterium]|nr:hypothetical protein [Clostridiales bacterium]